MERVSVTYTYIVKYWINDYICLTECGKYINTKLGKEVRQFMRGSNKAIYINGIANLTKQIKPYKKEAKCPF